MVRFACFADDIWRGDNITLIKDEEYADVNEISHSKSIVLLFVPFDRNDPVWRDLKKETKDFGTATEKKRHW